MLSICVKILNMHMPVDFTVVRTQAGQSFQKCLQSAVLVLVAFTGALERRLALSGHALLQPFHLLTLLTLRTAWPMLRKPVSFQL